MFQNYEKGLKYGNINLLELMVKFNDYGCAIIDESLYYFVKTGIRKDVYVIDYIKNEVNLSKTFTDIIDITKYEEQMDACIEYGCKRKLFYGLVMEDHRKWILDNFNFNELNND